MGEPGENEGKNKQCESKKGVVHTASGVVSTRRGGRILKNWNLHKTDGDIDNSMLIAAISVTMLSVVNTMTVSRTMLPQLTFVCTSVVDANHYRRPCFVGWSLDVDAAGSVLRAEDTPRMRSCEKAAPDMTYRARHSRWHRLFVPRSSLAVQASH